MPSSCGANATVSMTSVAPSHLPIEWPSSDGAMFAGCSARFKETVRVASAPSASIFITTRSSLTSSVRSCDSSVSIGGGTASQPGLSRVLPDMTAPSAARPFR